jgi:hypothetical protein
MLDPFRDFEDEAEAAAEAPRADTADIELLLQSTRIRFWALRTSHPLEAVLAEGFFDGTRDVRFKKEDRIEVVASFDAPVATHCTLVVDSVDKATGIPEVSLMHRYVRCRP